MHTSHDLRRTEAVRLDTVSKIYGRADSQVAALRELSMSFADATFTAVMGPSGSGKSTFLHCAAGLVRPTSGSVTVGGTDLADLDDTQLTMLRRDRIGFIFQSFNLLPALTVMQNITLPLQLAGKRPDKNLIRSVVQRVGLADRLGHLPSELSGGQQQRVAIARALVTQPAVVFADEPTGALDTRTASAVLSLLRESVDNARQTLVMVTHDPVAASYADRVVFLADGALAGELHRPTADAVAARMTRLGAWEDENRQQAAPMTSGGLY
ncbi:MULTISPECIES: ABC transporter ATP-binding protein [Streptomyces]|uniref:ABC transporter ATP-binding protein n=1 Tax=[Kitasatospora] papulosa TaxID=1464011 RepID=A0ABZ1KBX5_9ACTN|nr:MULTISPECIES: ABC transporter ATP-binding protein [Streptomyces]RAS29132.1 putative ABC transport system ATP-binding protein [Streptomyces avidinii]SNX78473.1 putative ABC transport system ATP-binding protein [Streptomyces microflavus]MDX2619516.1 ABC transporter ATP-binding protein [Streptomyces sp. WI03-5b]MEE1776136.1 ABC transporter ATP-binding protein [Streptomyces sp. JV181]WSI16509.1 ABC transporter ATP-binding protein [[Kitasatospora] papulosa]